MSDPYSPPPRTELILPPTPHPTGSHRAAPSSGGPYAPPASGAGQVPPQPVPAAPVVAYMPQPMPVPVVMEAPKSVGVALVLTFFFGAFGMFYSTITGALVMLGAALAYAVLTGVLTILTLGVAAVVMLPLALVFWPIQMIWAAMAASSHNERIRAQAHAAMAAPYGPPRW